MTELREICKSPYPQRLILAKRLIFQVNSEPKDKLFVMSAILLPPLCACFVKDIRNMANLRITQTALAVESFRVAHEDNLPQSLDDLVPSILTTIPTDPYDGKPLRYRRLAKGYVVYTIADDGRDDGGAEYKSSKDSSGSVSQRSSYDWTFIVER